MVEQKPLLEEILSRAEVSVKELGEKLVELVGFGAGSTWPERASLGGPTSGGDELRRWTAAGDQLRSAPRC